jgi:hypothetical protein
MFISVAKRKTSILPFFIQYLFFKYLIFKKFEMDEYLTKKDIENELKCKPCYLKSEVAKNAVEILSVQNVKKSF